jgi:hypothetical protein
MFHMRMNDDDDDDKDMPLTIRTYSNSSAHYIGSQHRVQVLL